MGVTPISTAKERPAVISAPTIAAMPGSARSRRPSPTACAPPAGAPSVIAGICNAMRPLPVCARPFALHLCNALWRICNKPMALPGGAVDVDAELADLLAQRIAVQTEKLRRPDLVATRRRHRRQHQRIFHLLQHALVEAGRRQFAVEAGEIALEVALDRLGDGQVAGKGLVGGRRRRCARAA